MATRKPFSPEQLMSLFAVMENCKVAVICYIALVTGMRISEILSLKIQYIDFGLKRIFHPKTKGGKERTYIINNTTISILKKWISLLGDTDYLFPSSKGGVEHTTPTGFYTEYRRVLKKAGLWLEKKEKSKAGKKQHVYNFHNFRTTFGSMLVNSDVPIYTAKELMGHSKVSTTEKYYVELGSKAMQRGLDLVFGKDVNKKTKEFEREKARIFQKEIEPQNIQESLRDPLHLLKIKLVNGEISIGEFNEKSKLLMNLEKEKVNCFG